MRVLEKMRAMARNEQGLSTVEYVVLLVLIVGMSVGVWNEFGQNLEKQLGKAHDEYKKNVKM